VEQDVLVEVLQELLVQPFQEFQPLDHLRVLLEE
jgi:hypothetical protein